MFGERIELKVYNGGVFGYGTAQSFLRYKTNKDNLVNLNDLIIFSSVLGNDFKREQEL